MKRLAFAAAVALCLTAPAAWAQGGLDRLRAMDANGDGTITRAEAEAARGVMFGRLDGDHDDFISPAERDGAHNPRARRALEGADANQDGRISRAELMARPYAGFDRLDANSDGVISAAELEAVRARRNGG